MGQLQAHLSRHPQYLDVQLTGRVDVAEMTELLKRLGTVTRRYGDNCVLFDLMGLKGDLPVGELMLLGEQIVHWLPHLLRVASVVDPARLKRVAEGVARSHGMQMTVFDSRQDAIAWLGQASARTTAERPSMDAAHKAIWDAFKHLFPMHAQAIQLPNGTLAISWSVAGESGARYDMATPITVRLEPELVVSLTQATSAQRKRIASHQEAAFRAGLMGYDPYAAVPSARVIVLG